MHNTQQSPTCSELQLMQYYQFTWRVMAQGAFLEEVDYTMRLLVLGAHLERSSQTPKPVPSILQGSLRYTQFSAQPLLSNLETVDALAGMNSLPSLSRFFAVQLSQQPQQFHSEDHQIKFFGNFLWFQFQSLQLILTRYFHLICWYHNAHNLHLQSEPKETRDGYQ